MTASSRATLRPTTVLRSDADEDHVTLLATQRACGGRRLLAGMKPNTLPSTLMIGSRYPGKDCHSPEGTPEALVVRSSATATAPMVSRDRAHAGAQHLATTISCHRFGAWEEDGLQTR